MAAILKKIDAGFKAFLKAILLSWYVVARIFHTRRSSDWLLQSARAKAMLPGDWIGKQYRDTKHVERLWRPEHMALPMDSASRSSCCV
jgi:hypothetical protein